jgi:hypothetical protein
VQMEGLDLMMGGYSATVKMGLKHRDRLMQERLPGEIAVWNGVKEAVGIQSWEEFLEEGMTTDEEQMTTD